MKSKKSDRAAAESLQRDCRARLTSRTRRGHGSPTFAKRSGQLVRTSPTDPSLALFGHGSARPVAGAQARARRLLLEKNGKHVGVEGRGLGQPLRVLGTRGLRIDVWEPRVGRLPVDGAHVAMASLLSGEKSRLLGLKSDAPWQRPRSGSFRLSPEDALGIWAENARVRLPPRERAEALREGLFTVERVWAPTPDGLRAAYRVACPNGVPKDLERTRGISGLRVILDAENGRVLRSLSEWKHARLRLSAYDQNPVKSPRNIDRMSSIVDPRELESELGRNDGGTTLLNQYFDVVPGWGYEGWDIWFVQEREGRANGTGTGGRSFVAQYSVHPRISESNTFFHLNRLREFFLRLDPGFTTHTPAATGRMTAYVDVVGWWGAAANPGGALRFHSMAAPSSVPGVTPARASLGDDAEVIAHEYAHEVHYTLAPNLRAADAAEAIGDFFSAIYAHDTTLGELYTNRREVLPVYGLITLPPPIIYPTFSPERLSGHREIYNDYRYPEDYTGDSHLNSRILSGAWLELHHEMFRRFGDEDYFLVARAVLWTLPLLTPRLDLDEEEAQDGHGIRDAAETFFNFVVETALGYSYATSPEFPKWLALGQESLRVLSRRGLL